MAINRSVERKPVSVAEAQLARVAGEGCARHPHLNALLEASGPHSAPRSCRRGAPVVQPSRPLSGPDRNRAPALPERRSPLVARPCREAFERERLLSGPADLRGRSAAEHAGRGGNRDQPGRRPACARNTCHVGAQGLRVWVPRRRLSGTGGRSADCSIVPRRAVGLECPAPSLPDEASVIEVIHARDRTLRRASGRWRSAASNCCSSTVRCSTCSKPAPPRAGTSNLSRFRQLVLLVRGRR